MCRCGAGAPTRECLPQDGVIPRALRPEESRVHFSPPSPLPIVLIHAKYFCAEAPQHDARRTKKLQITQSP